MIRPKSNPPIRKPVFDDEAALRFAAGGEPIATGSTDSTSGGVSAGKGKGKKKAEGDEGSIPLTLNLTSDVIARLEAEAARKGKSMDQVVEKLVTKHLAKHEHKSRK
jgi:hypothetical protein